MNLDELTPQQRDEYFMAIGRLVVYGTAHAEQEHGLPAITITSSICPDVAMLVVGTRLWEEIKDEGERISAGQGAGTLAAQVLAKACKG